jgi:glutamate-1-semialdehyde 2,1-aminomutase
MSLSVQYFQDAQQYIPGGVNSPVRAFKSVGGDPVFFQSAKGAYVTDVDGNSYIDYVGSWGPMILGHAHPEVIAAVQETAASGLSFGAPTQIETLLAKKVCDIVPNMDRVRFCSSGTEATMSAIRVARGFTGRDKIVKFEGCYHGHSDALLVKAGSGLLTMGTPSSAGVPEDCVKDTLTLQFNDIEGLEQTLQSIGSEVACVIIEPVAGNMNLVKPEQAFLEKLRELCTEHGIVLIFDEVMTGFRTALGGCQQKFGIDADMVTLGKVIGGGMPVGAFGGRAEIMEVLSPLGSVYQAGTLSGNPVAMVAGLTTLELISVEGFHDSLEASCRALCEGLLAAAKTADIDFTVDYIGGMFGIYFTNQENIKSFADATACDGERFRQFFHGMLRGGVYLAPSAFEAGFMSAAHSEAEIKRTVEVAASVFAEMAKL